MHHRFHSALLAVTALVGAGSVTSLHAQPAITEAFKLLPSDGGAYDYFSQRMAIDGNTAVISSYGKDDNGIFDSGAVFVFERIGARWVETQKLFPADAAVSAGFGSSVDIDGDTIVVGAPNRSTTSGSNAGAAYVFERVGGVWTQSTDGVGSPLRLEASDGGAFEAFGKAVAIDGNIIVVGASSDNENGSGAGAVYVFEPMPVWTQTQKIMADDSGFEAMPVYDFDFFGGAVDISGDTVIVGSNDETAGTVPGAAYLFVRQGGTFVQLDKLTASDRAGDDYFGTSVAIDGDTAVVGAFRDDNAAGDDAGAAYVFRRSGMVWSEQQKLVSNDLAAGDQFGFDVAVDGNSVLIGAQLNDDGAPSTGNGYLFERSGSTWTQTRKYASSDALQSDALGNAVALSGDIAILGAYGRDDNGDFSGAAYTFGSPALPLLLTLADMNSNGIREIAVLRAGSAHVEIRDGQNGVLLRNVGFLDDSYTIIDAAPLADLDGDGALELAVLAIRNSDARAVVEVRNLSSTPTPRLIWFMAGAAPVGIRAIPTDADDNGIAEIAVMSVRDSDGRIAVEVKNAFGPTNPNTLWYASGHTPIDFDILNDADNNGVEEVAVLSRRDSDGRVVVEVKNALGATNPNAVWFSSNAWALDLAIVGDKDNADGLPELAVLSTRTTDGRNFVEVKNAYGATSPSTVWFMQGATASQLVGHDDNNPSTVPQVIVRSVRDSDGRNVVEVKDAVAPPNTSTLWSQGGFTAYGLAVIDDTNSDGIDQALVLLVRNYDGRIMVESRNISGAQSPYYYWFSP